MFMLKPWYQRFYNYATITLGMTSFHYNATSRTYKQQLWMQALALVANLWTILSLPFIFWNAMKRSSTIQWNPIMTYIDYVTNIIRSLAVLYIILERPKIDRVNYDVLCKYRRLRKTYLALLPRVAFIERHMNRLIYAKYINMSILIVITAVIFIQGTEFEWTWSNCYFLLMVLQTTTILRLTTFNFFWFLWSICHSLKYVQWYIRHLLQETSDSVRHCKRWRLNMLAGDVQRILEAHWQLSELAWVLMRNYRFLALAVFLDEITSLERQLYYGIIFTFDHRAELRYLVVGTTYFCALTFNIYLGFLICDLTVKTYYACINQLGCIYAMNVQSKALEETCTDFGLNAALSRFSINIYGMFDMNHRATLTVLRNAVMHALILIQFDHVVDPAKRHVG
ncbi:PREDICTED: putative gustatory receptor 59b [Bactrocera latifrons]|uniref:putative gustatory receptor 59b n=1 Tax=Bactrocera latifrons TaxID=174628 RepID=UPI0008DCB381|nr:PREDICTED: putative gustatory receptor 59b [Bactrocera latifrons]